MHFVVNEDSCGSSLHSCMLFTIINICRAIPPLAFKLSPRYTLMPKTARRGCIAGRRTSTIGRPNPEGRCPTRVTEPRSVGLTLERASRPELDSITKKYARIFPVQAPHNSPLYVADKTIFSTGRRRPISLRACGPNVGRARAIDETSRASGRPGLDVRPSVRLCIGLETATSNIRRRFDFPNH